MEKRVNKRLLRVLVGLLMLCVAGGARAQGNNGTWTGTPTYVTGQFSNAGSFDGSTRSITIPDVAFTHPAGTSWAEDCWLKCSVTTGLFVAKGRYVGGSSPGFWYIGISGGKATCAVGSFTGITGATTIADGTWHHIEIDITSGTSLQMFVDGVSAGTVTGTFVGATAGTGAGYIAHWGSPGYDFIGSVDEGASWSVLRHSANFTPSIAAYTGAESGLIALYHLDSNALDSKGSTLVNAYADGANWRKSPYNHNVVGSGAASVDTTVNVGAYWRTYEVGSATAVLTFSATVSSAYLAYRWDGGAWTRIAQSSSVTLSNVPTAGTVKHLLEWCFCASSITTDRWSNSPPTNAIQFTGATFDSGTTLSQPASRPKTVVVFGDSIKEGTRVYSANTGYPSTDNDITLSAYFQLQDVLNCELGLVVFSGQDVISTANSASANVPNLLNSYNLLYAGVSRSFAAQPDLCIIDEGQNGSGQNATTYAANLVTIAQGVGARKTLLMGDESGFQTTATANAAAILGANTAYGTPAAIVIGGGATADTYDGVHATAAAHRSKLLPAVAAPSYALLYGTGAGATTVISGTKRKVQ